MRIITATQHFESWLGERIPILRADLKRKHALMREAPFPFLRATFYRWAQVWPKVCPELAKAPHVLAVGDLHVENFGTWRDAEGRLIWGVNDFDEAHPMSYANDLVRLAVSAHLAAETGNLQLKEKDICDSILEGYRDSLRAQGTAFVLGENNKWLRLIAENERLKAENALLETQASRLRNDDIYVQRVIREEFGYARPDEFVYRFRSTDPSHN